MMDPRNFRLAQEKTLKLAQNNGESHVILKLKLSLSWFHGFEIFAQIFNDYLMGQILVLSCV